MIKMCCATGERTRLSKLNHGIMAIFVYMIHLQVTEAESLAQCVHLFLIVISFFTSYLIVFCDFLY